VGAIEFGVQRKKIISTIHEADQVMTSILGVPDLWNVRGIEIVFGQGLGNRV
jgi:hypothetical protein